MLVQPHKSLSQNFLVNEDVQKRIVESLPLKESSTVLEIGPGMGALTQHLVKRPFAALWLVEYDRRCVEYLTEHFIAHDNVHLCHADILHFDWHTLPPDPLIIIGNIPYNITSPLLIHCLKAPSLQASVLMVQKEVAQRITAKPHTKAYGRLSIVLQLHTDIEVLLQVPAENFSPQPKVDSTVLRFTPKGFAPTPEEARTLSMLTNACFQQRRKKIANSLKHHYPHYAQALKELGISTSARPENLTPEEFYALAKALMQCA